MKFRIPGQILLSSIHVDLCRDLLDPLTGEQLAELAKEI